jgi:hypothetical protein
LEGDHSRLAAQGGIAAGLGSQHTLPRFLDQHRDKWEMDHLWIKLDHRWTGALDIAKRLRDKAEGGIPWTAILDADGKVLATSNDSKGTNIGFPGDAAAVVHFSAMLRSTAQRLTEADIVRLRSATRSAPLASTCSTFIWLQARLSPCRHWARLVARLRFSRLRRPKRSAEGA